MNQNMPGVEAIGLMCGGFLMLVGAVISGVFCLSLQRTMAAVAPRNRQMPAGLVWLHLLNVLYWLTREIPVVGPYLGPVIGIFVGGWDVLMVLKIAGSIRGEYKARKLPTKRKDFGRKVGLPWACIWIGIPVVQLLTGTLLEQLGADDDLIGVVGLMLLFLHIVQLALFVIYWVQIYGYGTELQDGGRKRRTAEEEDYEEDYRPQRRRSRRRDEDDEEEEDDAPRSRRRRRDEDEEEDDDAPRSRRRRADEDDDEEEERPRRRRKVEDDEDEEERPRRRRRDDDD